MGFVVKRTLQNVVKRSSVEMKDEILNRIATIFLVRTLFN